MAKILVVEDQDNIRKLIRINLERAGHTVCEAGGKDEGLALAESEQPDLICLDVMMPKGTEGFQFVWTLRNTADAPLKDVPIIMLTGIHDHTELRFYPESEDGTYKKGEYLPVQAFLDKPIDPDKLLAAVQEHLM
ncbi:MAG: response regulator [Armatimonadetes bacterium]|nr:response regulator [Armatimonadota bacterium]